MKLLYLLPSVLLAVLYFSACYERDLALTQRDEAFALAAQHQSASRYWFNTAIQTAAHYAAKENR